MYAFGGSHVRFKHAKEGLNTAALQLGFVYLGARNRCNIQNPVVSEGPRSEAAWPSCGGREVTAAPTPAPPQDTNQRSRSGRAWSLSGSCCSSCAHERRPSRTLLGAPGRAAVCFLRRSVPDQPFPSPTGLPQVSVVFMTQPRLSAIASSSLALQLQLLVFILIFTASLGIQARVGFGRALRLRCITSPVGQACRYHPPFSRQPRRPRPPTPRAPAGHLPPPRLQQAPQARGVLPRRQPPHVLHGALLLRARRCAPAVRHSVALTASRPRRYWAGGGRT